MKKMKWLFVVLSILLLTALIGCKPQLSAPGTVPPGTIPPAESDSDYFELLEGQQPGRAVQTINTVQLKAEYRPDGSKYDRLPAALFIPKTISGKIVQGIAPGALKGVTRITAITIPEGILSIGSNALEGCTALTSITVPSTVTHISAGAFKGCSKVTIIAIESTTLEQFDGTALATGGRSLDITVTSEEVKNKVEEGKQAAESGGVDLPTIPPPAVVPPGSILVFINSGISKLVSNDYDGALADFDLAYKRNPNDNNAKFFYALAQMGSISVKQEMATFMRNRLGIKNYPGTMNALLSDSWMPELDKPSWLPESSGLIGRQLNQSTFWMYLPANVLEKNVDGLNDAIDDIISLCFGTEFTTAVSAVESISNNFVATLTQDQLKAFKLDIVLGDLDISELKFGKAELLVLFGGLELVKGAIETLGSFSLNTDLTFLKANWYEKPEQILTNIQAGGWNSKSDIFNNGFLDRRPEHILSSQKSYSNAVGKLISACDLYEAASDNGNSTLGGLAGTYMRPVKLILSEFKNSVDNKRAFYFPNDLLDLINSNNLDRLDNYFTQMTTWPTTETNAMTAIDFSVLFDSSKLTLDRIVATQSGTGGKKAPIIYKMSGTVGEVARNLEGPYDSLAVKIKYDDISALSPFVVNGMLPPENGGYVPIYDSAPATEAEKDNPLYKLVKFFANYYYGW